MSDSRLELVQGDITKVTADAIVNAANSALLPQVEKVTVVLFTPWDLEVYRRALAGEPEPEGGLGR
ncbi:MAG: hypothetical protein ACJ8AT_21970 [Hyalangium sp.]|uniref:hypothetical protein n=1 Tax=Hyalangium sp. TaxID=2028555 RepID=UPI003899A41D